MTFSTEYRIEKRDNADAAQSDEVKSTRSRRRDNGAQVLAHMEHFVGLVRKVRRPYLLCEFLEGVLGEPLPSVRALTEGCDGSLPLASRNALFAIVATFAPERLTRLEQGAERVNLLCDDFGALAVGDLLEASRPSEAALLEVPTDKFSRALYLYLQQECPASCHGRDNRFDHAETRQLMLLQSLSEKYSSHYLGPKGVEPMLDVLSEAALKRRLTELFPAIEEEDIVVERFEHRDLSLPEKPVVLYTLTAMFNGKQVYFQQVANGEVEDHEEPAVTNVRFAWQPERGALAVFCDDEEVRPLLAGTFRDVVLGGGSDLHSMPMREFDLTGFCTPAMLTRLKADRVDGIERIEIKRLTVAKPEIRQTSLRGRTVERRVENPLSIGRHRFEDRDIYTMAREVHGHDDLTGYVVLQVRLSIHIAKSAHRKAHTVAVQVTAPNGFNDRSKTNDDSELIFRQLMRLDCARQH